VAPKPKTKLEHTVKVGGRTFKLRSNKPFFPALNEEEVRATIPQFRQLAYGSATLLVEKILAGDRQGFPATISIRDAKGLKPGYRGLGPRRPFQHVSLNEEYLERKVAEGLDPRPLIATGFYIGHIEVQERKRKGARFWVVTPARVKHRPSGVWLRVLAGWLEFGTPESSPGGRMPARPHWRPTALVVRRKWERLPKDIRVEALKETLRKMR